jgi:hypothetical protein
MRVRTANIRNPSLSTVASLQTSDGKENAVFDGKNCRFVAYARKGGDICFDIFIFVRLFLQSAFRLKVRL